MLLPKVRLIFRGMAKAPFKPWAKARTRAVWLPASVRGFTSTQYCIRQLTFPQFVTFGWGRKIQGINS